MGKNSEMVKRRNVLFGLVLVTMLIVPSACMGTGEMQRVFPENDTAGYVPVDIIVIAPEIKAATPDYTYLVLDDEGKANYLRDLDADFDLLYGSDPRKETEYAALATKLNAIWEKYPVVSEIKPGSAGYPAYGGSEITIRFAPSVTETRLIDDENTTIRESSKIMNEAYWKIHPAQSSPLPVIFTLLSAGLAYAVYATVRSRSRP